MRDPLTWSVPIGRWFGISVKIHVLFPVVVVALILRAAVTKDAPAGVVSDAAILMAILIVSVLLHEFGHCAGARLADGDAHEILLWPLGGLASMELPHKPRAHFIAVAAGPAVNLILCVITALGLWWATEFRVRPPFDPFWAPFRSSESVLGELFTWQGQRVDETSLWPAVLLARFFWVNWVLLLLNVLVIGFPLDGGRLFQALLWPWYGYRQATLYAIYAGFVCMLVVGICGIAFNQVLVLCLALFIYYTCRQQWIFLETGGEESPFGYDFSQGYTSLEGDPPLPRRKRPNVWQRWLQRRTARRRQRKQEQREAEERRMDELLEKVQREGLAALSEEERRFLKRVSDRYRHR
jgi:Zn-dependent protease